MAISHVISGTTLPVVTIALKPGDKLYSSSGGMSWMTQQVEMDTNTGGGLGKMFKRAVSGESVFVVDYYVNSGEGEVAFAAEFPGKIVPIDLDDGQSIIVQKDAFMCAEKIRGPGYAFPQEVGGRSLWRRGLYPATVDRAGHGLCQL